MAHAMEIVQWVSAIVGCTLGIFALTYVVVRRVLVPYLREEIAAPVSRIDKQLTNGNRDPAHPTALDSIGMLVKQGEHLLRQMDDLTDRMGRLAERIGHLEEESRRRPWQRRPTDTD